MHKNGGLAMDYYSLRGLCAEYQNGTTNLSDEELVERIDEAYQSGEIAGNEYDHLMRLVE